MENLTQMLALMDRPAFCVERGTIIDLNTAARSLSLSEGMSVGPLLSTGQDVYAEFTEGCLGLELMLDGGRCSAAVTVVDGRHLFTVEPSRSEDDLRMLSLAAQALRSPLSDVMALVEALPEDTSQRANISRSLHRLLRIVGNMTPPPPFCPEMMDLNALLREIWDQAQPACEEMGVRFSFVPTPAPVYSMVDGDLLARAIHNLLSNSMKFPKGDDLRMELKRDRDHFYIHFWSSGVGLLPDPFFRYLREPGLEDPKTGLGMGLHLVYKAVIAHGGSVMMLPKEGGLLTHIRIPIEIPPTALRSNRLRISYTGERDPLLVELSDVLPPKFYE